MIWIAMLLSLFTGAFSGYGAQTARVSTHVVGPKLQRLPVQKRNITLTAPKKYEKRILRYDSGTGQRIYYDPKSQVVLLDARAGRYALKWIGYDGKEKTVVY